MFSRILHDNWTTIIPIVSFFLTAGVFGTALVRSLRMQKNKIETLASLPLEDDQT